MLQATSNTATSLMCPTLAILAEDWIIGYTLFVNCLRKLPFFLNLSITFSSFLCPFKLSLTSPLKPLHDSLHNVKVMFINVRQHLSVTNSLFIITRPYHDLFCKWYCSSVVCLLLNNTNSHYLLKKESIGFISSIFERKHFKEKLTYTSLYLNITYVYHICVISNLSSASKEFTGNTFLLHTHIHINTDKHTH